MTTFELLPAPSRPPVTGAFLSGPTLTSPVYNVEGFARLWERTERTVASVVRRRTPGASLEDREDLVQEVCLRAWRGFGRYDPRVPFERWACGIALRACVDRLRERNCRVTTVSAVADKEGQTVIDRVVAPGPSPFEAAAWNDLSPTLSDALGALPPRHWKALRMVAGGAELTEVGAALGCTSARASQIVNVARRRAAAVLAAA